MSPQHVVPPRGVIGAALTPFRDNATVNSDALGREVDFLAQHCDAISVLGPEASEYRTLTEQQRVTTLAVGIEAADGQVPVIAGVSDQSPTTVLRLINQAAAAGASFGQLLIPRQPGGPPATLGDLVSYVKQVAEASDLPIILYHNPARGTDTNAEQMIELCSIDGVVGIKESSRDITKIGLLCQHIDEAGTARYYTTMQALLPTLDLGGSGAMMPPPATLIAARLVNNFDNNNHAEAVKWQRLFRSWPGSWRQFDLASIMKESMRALGFELGDPARPFSSVPSDKVIEIGAWMDENGIGELLAEHPGTSLHGSKDRLRSVAERRLP
jgi:4-hydroxy-tetrahydrodipicolinate synthase